MLSYAPNRKAFARSLRFIAWVAASVISTYAVGAPYVEFDFARSAECRDVTPPERIALVPTHRFVQLVLPVSVRFRGLSMNDVEELDIEINGAAAGLRVIDFSPMTQLASDIAQEIETTTTTKRARSLDGTLGGGLPVPYAGLVAHVSPSINAGLSGSETATEKLNRLPPKHAIVVSGTSSEGRGVFFKLKRSSQTSLEGVHELAVTFVVPADWRGGKVRVGCSARGQRRILLLKHDATLGRAAGDVQLHRTDGGMIREVAKPVLADKDDSTPNVALPASYLEAATAGMRNMLAAAAGANTTPKKSQSPDHKHPEPDPHAHPEADDREPSNFRGGTP
ncbi:MAG TPA: hypothetical protein VHK01_13210 [Lacipirellulaceae bacterium]|jgi:hypothetical protein|nr:hypothetical protein [Lacipirellulaceae bacterium]